MVNYNELKDYLCGIAHCRVSNFAEKEKDVRFLAGRIVYTLQKRRIYPYCDGELPRFVRIQLDAEFLNGFLADYLGRFNDDPKELYHTGVLRDILEEWFDVRLDGYQIGLYKDHVKAVCECGERAKFIPRNKIEPGRKGYIYLCDCGRFVGVHIGTNIPLGIPTDRETRALRAKCHKSFDKKWRTPEERENTYRWLSEKMKLTKAQTHFGKMNKEQCREALRILEEDP